MPIPDFQSTMLPLLELAADGVEHRSADADAALADWFGLTHEERAQLLPSGRQATFSNRLLWSSSYLRNAGLFESTDRGRFRITDAGRSALAGCHAQDPRSPAAQPRRRSEPAPGRGGSPQVSEDALEILAIIASTAAAASATSVTGNPMLSVRARYWSGQSG